MDCFQPSYFFDVSEFRHRALFNDCRYIWEVLSRIKSYLSTQSLGNIEIDIPNGAYLENAETISIGKGSVVEPGAYIKGPCIIGENCSIRQGAYVRGLVIAGNECILGHDSEFKNAILLNHAYAGHFAYVGDSILGNYVNLGAGTICANLKLNQSPISIFVENQRIHTGLRKLGAIIGDHSQTGCHSVLNPGALLGKSVFCYPNVNFGGFIPSHKIIYSDAKIVIKDKHD